MRAVSEVNGSLTPPNGSAATIVTIGRRELRRRNPSTAFLRSGSRPAPKDSWSTTRMKLRPAATLSLVP